MATVAPWHSLSPSEVYHMRDDCPRWEQESPENRIPGTNGRLCVRCFILLAGEIGEGWREVH